VTKLAKDRLVLLLVMLLVLFLLFSPFVYFLLELINALFQLVDILPQLAYFRFLALLLTTLGFATFVQLVTEAVEFAPDFAEIAQELRLAPLVRHPFVVVRLVPPSLKSFQIASEHPEFAPDLRPRRTFIFLRHWTVLLPDRQRHYRYRRWVDCMCGNLAQRVSQWPAIASPIAPSYTISRCTAASARSNLRLNALAFDLIEAKTQ
jgi:hypothetical protein